MSRIRVCREVVCALGVAAASFGGLNCDADTEDAAALVNERGGLVADSVEAHMLVTQVRREFQVQPAWAELPLFTEELADLVGEGPALRPSAADGFVLDDGRLVPVLAEGSVDPRAARPRLPTRASEPFEVVDPETSLTVRARLLGASDAPAAVAGGFVVFRGALPGVDVIHRVSSAGLEDMLRIEAPPAGGSEIRYQLELGEGVAGLRLVGGSLEMIDATGTPRLRVAPPYLVDAAGARREAALAVERCAVDTDPSPPWGREPVEPGSTSCELVVSWDEGAAYPILLDPDWVQTGTMGTARVYHESVLLSSGYVMVMGGVTTGGAITASAEIYNPAGSGSWSPTGSMSDNRYGFGSAVVSYGGTEYVVVAGGGSSSCSGGPYCNQAERWTSAGSWNGAGTMNTRRAAFPLTALTDTSQSYRAMACGGINATQVEYSAETYNPSSNSWANTSGFMSARRYGHTASGLSGSWGHRVLVAGGRDGSNAILSSAEKYYPNSNQFESTGSMGFGRYAHTTTTIAGDEVLAVAGQYTDAACIRRTEVWSPVANGWSYVATVPGRTGLCRHAAARLEDGKVVVMGGRGSPSTGAIAESWVYDPSADSWTATDDMWAGRYGHTAVLYPVAGGDNDKVVAAGGIIWTGLPTAYAERFTPP